MNKFKFIYILSFVFLVSCHNSPNDNYGCVTIQDYFSFSSLHEMIDFDNSLSVPEYRVPFDANIISDSNKSYHLTGFRCQTNDYKQLYSRAFLVDNEKSSMHYCLSFANTFLDINEIKIDSVNNLVWKERENVNYIFVSPLNVDFSREFVLSSSDKDINYFSLYTNDESFVLSEDIKNSLENQYLIACQTI